MRDLSSSGVPNAVSELVKIIVIFLTVSGRDSEEVGNLVAKCCPDQLTKGTTHRSRLQA